MGKAQKQTVHQEATAADGCEDQDVVSRRGAWILDTLQRSQQDLLMNYM